MYTEKIRISQFDSDAIEVLAEVYHITKQQVITCMIGYAISGAGMTFRQYVASTNFNPNLVDYGRTGK